MAPHRGVLRCAIPAVKYVIARSSVPCRPAFGLHCCRTREHRSLGCSHFHSTAITREPQPADVSSDEFHDIADEYLDTLCEKLEDMQDTRTELDVEYSSGVMNVVIPGAGTYVLNKQPPNKQIWLSSPVTGPKRYDWVVSGNKGDWIYLRDGSSLTTLLKTEMGVIIGDD